MVKPLVGLAYILEIGNNKASIAQWIEQQPSKLWVVSSSLTGCTNNIIMTIKELYIFAINNSLLDEEVSIVVSKYHEKESKVIQPVKSLDLNKVEYTFDDLIALFT